MEAALRDGDATVMRRRIVLLLRSCLLVGMALGPAHAYSQEMPSAPSYDAGAAGGGASAQDDANDPVRGPRSQEGNDTAGRANAGERDDVSTSAPTLSANQIIDLLHRRAEAVVDAKHVVAEYFRKQGLAVQEDAITDEMLFSNIATNSGLRRTLSTWLRARGYAADSQFADSQFADSEFDNPRDRTVSDALPLSTENDLGIANEEDAMSGDAASALRMSSVSGDVPSEMQSDGRPDLPLQRADSTERRDAARALGQRGANSSERNSETGRSQPARSDAIDVLHQDAPYNLQAMRDLYTQVPEQTASIKRFGADVFLTRGAATREMPIDLPIGPDYILGPGDGLTISMWGGVSQSFTRVIDREGKVVLPEAGSVIVAGLTLERAQALVQGTLAPQFRDAHVAVSVSRLRTVRVYVVGDVQKPGAYDISSLSTPLNALYAAGGPTSVGSLRTVRHYRGKTLIREVDLYEFLLHGVRSDVERMQPGDTILVPAAGPQVEVAGMVKRPAIYEFKNQISLWDALEEAGGLRVAAALAHIRVERMDPDGHRSTVDASVAEGSTVDAAHTRLAAFIVRDGDRIVVAPALPYSEKAIYLAGHVVRPGKLAFHEGMKLSDAIRSYQDLLPEPADRGEIIRLMPPDLRPVAIEFNVADAVAGGEPIFLQPFDTIRIRGRYETDAPRVIIRGEVLQPGDYALISGMTAAQLVRLAGGFRRSALLDAADLASYEIKDGRKVVGRRRTLAIGNAVEGHDTNADALLKPGDVLTIHQVSGWSDIGASVMLTGEVTYPGTYGLQEGERLSSVIARAGGFRTTAYAEGAVLVRTQVKELEQKSRAELIRQIETTSVGAKLGQNISGSDDAATLQLLVQQQNQVLQRLRSQPAVGRLVIRMGNNTASWANTPADVELRSGDVLTVPKRPGFILVSGQVYNASAITFLPGKSAEWYLRQAGGASDLANRKEIFVVRANGLVVGRRSGGWYRESVLSTRLNPGDVIVVPQKIVGGSVFWRNMLATAQVASSIAFTAVLALR
jgi:protein involved in polysaccharide export with SLBB domain